MRSRRLRWLGYLLTLYFLACSIGGIYLADGTLHPGRRPLEEQDIAEVRQWTKTHAATLEDVSIKAMDGIALRGWIITPASANGDAVILLHGLGDNRLGTLGYAQMLLTHGYTVLLPDARAHGLSGGELATYGLLERTDIREWGNFLSQRNHPHCIDGIGESMGAAELLQSLADGALFCAVVAESSFANFREIAYDRMGQAFHLGPWVGRTILRPMVEVAFLRARWKYKLEMKDVSPEEAVQKSKIPVLLIHGEIDSNIPLRHSHLIQASSPSVQLWAVPGADHCGAIAVAPSEFETRVLNWFERSSKLQVTKSAANLN